jgi:hypothetical protein
MNENGGVGGNAPLSSCEAERSADTSSGCAYIYKTEERAIYFISSVEKLKRRAILCPPSS